MSSWSKDHTLEFIEKYRSHECVWKIKSKEYHNRDLREAAYAELVDLVKKVDARATRDTVVKKINNLRSSFRKELKKVKRSQKSGMDTDEVYVPKLWYFHELQFLLDQDEEALEGVSNLDGSDQVAEDEAANGVYEGTVDVPLREHTPTARQQLQEAQNQIWEALASLKNDVERKSEINEKEEDECDLYGKLLAKKLKRIPEEERELVMYEIDGMLLNRRQHLQSGTTPSRRSSRPPSASTSK